MKKILVVTGMVALLAMTGCGQQGAVGQDNAQSGRESVTNTQTAAPAQNDEENSQQAPAEGEGQEQENPEEREVGFVFEIESAFALTGRGTTVSGTVESGRVKVGDTIYLVKADGTELETKVVLIEVFGGTQDEAVEGDSVGIELESLEKDQIAAGDQLVGYWSLETETEAESTFFSFEVEEVYAVTVEGVEGVVVTGYVQEGNMHTGSTASLITGTGPIYQTTVVGIEVYDSQTETTVMVESVGVDTPAGVLLEGLTGDQVPVGSILTGYVG